MVHLPVIVHMRRPDITSVIMRINLFLTPYLRKNFKLLSDTYARLAHKKCSLIGLEPWSWFGGLLLLKKASNPWSRAGFSGHAGLVRAETPSCKGGSLFHHHPQGCHRALDSTAS